MLKGKKPKGKTEGASVKEVASVFEAASSKNECGNTLN